MPILRQLDRLIEFHEQLKIDHMQISEFIYTNTALALVMRIIMDNEETPNSQKFFDRMCFVLTKYGNPVDIYNARFVPLRATHGFRVVIGAFTQTYTKDSHHGLSLSSWWNSKHQNSKNQITDSLKLFGINHMVTTPDDWLDILHEQLEVIGHCNPLLCLFTNQLWLPADGTPESQLSDYEALKGRAKECVEYIYSRLIGEFDVSVLDTNVYHVMGGDDYRADVYSSVNGNDIAFKVDINTKGSVVTLSIGVGNVEVADINKLVWEFITTTNANGLCKQLERIGIEDMFDQTS